MYSISAPSYAGPAAPLRFNLAVAALAAARTTPDKQALRLLRATDPQAPAETLTYGALDARVRRLIAGLNKLDVPDAARIALRLPTGLNYAVAFLAVTGAGHVALPLSPQLTGREVERIAELAGIAVLIHDGTLACGNAVNTTTAPVIEELESRSDIPGRFADTAADDPAFMVFTSGTGADPKGVLHAHHAVVGRRPMYADWYGASCNDVFLHTGAMNWTYSLGTGLIDPLVLGATATFLDATPEADAWGALLAASGASILASVPGLYRQLVHRDAARLLPGGFRHALTAGEALRPALLDDWSRLTGRPLLEAFGMSEISTYISTGPGMVQRPGSPGRPQHGRAVAVLDPHADAAVPLPHGEAGLLAVHRGDPGMMLAYLDHRPDAPDAFLGDWFITGDIAAMDADGYVWPQGRADDVINAMGYRVSPAEVEAALTACPGISEAAVVAVSPKAGVSIIKAFVVADKARRDAGGQALLDAVAAGLAAYKRPREIAFIDALPRTANGKIQRARLRRPPAR